MKEKVKERWFCTRMRFYLGSTRVLWKTGRSKKNIDKKEGRKRPWEYRGCQTRMVTADQIRMSFVVRTNQTRRKTRKKKRALG